MNQLSARFPKEYLHANVCVHPKLTLHRMLTNWNLNHTLKTISTCTLSKMEGIESSISLSGQHSGVTGAIIIFGS